MMDPKSDAKRRKLLKIIATGGGAVVAGKSLPENWARPVVDAVVLPVHAQTSTQCSFPAGCYQTAVFVGSISIPGGVEGSIIPGGLPVYLGVSDCSGQAGASSSEYAVARTAQEAAVILGIALADVREEIIVNPPAGGCRLWYDND